MKQKFVLGIAAAAFLMSGSLQVYAASFPPVDGKHFSLSRSGGLGPVKGGFDTGADAKGFHICIHGESPFGGGSAGFGFRHNLSHCDNDRYDFTYSVHGGFVKDSAHADSPNMKPGQDDQTQDGFWYREGPFSAPVNYGDVDNSNKRYADTPDDYPAWTWGHPEADPFVSPGGAGDNLGGSSGIGSAGFTAGINAGDNGIFYPFNFLQFNNNENSFFGSYSSDLSWNIKIFDRHGNEVYNHTFTNTLYYWETINFSNPTYGIVCPRETAKADEIVNDKGYNQSIHDNVTPYWPVFGLDINFISDGQTDTVACSDPVTFKYKKMNDTFSIGRFWHKKTYKVVLDGPYVYDSSVEGCPALTIKGLPDSDEAWKEKCFKKVDTIWVNERSTISAFMRLKITKGKRWF